MRLPAVKRSKSAARRSAIIVQSIDSNRDFLLSDESDTATMAEMTADAVRDICRKTKGYGTPHLNDKLYLHYKVRACGWQGGFRVGQPLASLGRWRRVAAVCNGLPASQGFRRIENLDAYTGVKVRLFDALS